MAEKSVTILGGGNTAFSVAANLALDGWSVTIGEIPGFEWAVEPILEQRVIHLDGVANQGAASIDVVTTDLAAALAANRLALLIVPAYAHRPFAEACAEHLRSDQIVVLLPGTLGSLEFMNIVRGRRPDLTIGGDQGAVFAETDTAPYVCRKVAPDRAHIWGVVSGMGIGVHPADQTDRIVELVDPLFPGLQPYGNVLACGLSSMNPVVHPAGVLLNVGRVERSRGEFYFYDEGVTPAVCRAIEAVDAERRAVGKAVGADLSSVAEAFHSAGFGPAGDLWAVINGSRMLTALKAPGMVKMRWLTEDVPYGIAVWCRLGAAVGVETPTMRALVDLASPVLEVDCWAEGRDLKDLGLDVPASRIVAVAEGAAVGSSA
jgi:opine dehydrogenase